MQPIGLSLKDIHTNPFTGETSGELMLVHLCLNCGRISTNRISGDDNPYSLISLLNHPPEKPIRISKLRLLSPADTSLVLTAIYGHSLYCYK